MKSKSIIKREAQSCLILPDNAYLPIPSTTNKSIRLENKYSQFVFFVFCSMCSMIACDTCFGLFS